jgi:hypothetical protein
LPISCTEFVGEELPGRDWQSSLNIERLPQVGRDIDREAVWETNKSFPHPEVGDAERDIVILGQIGGIEDRSDLRTKALDRAPAEASRNSGARDDAGQILADNQIPRMPLGELVHVGRGDNVAERTPEGKYRKLNQVGAVERRVEQR